MTEKENIAVIGAGLMGHGIAQIFAVQGHAVSLMDLQDGLLSNAIENIRANLSLMAQKGIVSATEIEPATQRIQTTTDLKEAVSGAQFVVEAVLEKLELKQEIFQDLDTLSPPDAVLATNTSVISITQIAQKSKNRNRIVGTHFWNPPYLIPLVEVVRGDETAPEVVEKTFALLQRVGKHPVRVHMDVPGFVGNRLQHALWREAISIVAHGIADAATVDECIKFGFGLRLPQLGPMENIDMVGTDLTLAIHDYILQHLENSPDSSPILAEKVARGDLGFKTGQGFQKWSPEQARQSRKELVEYLLKMTAQKGQ
jgi:3-hydroxybutyryl-CoA dehydrogenase